MWIISMIEIDMIFLITIEEGSSDDYVTGSLTVKAGNEDMLN